jgi:hypothetical protein
MRLPPGVLGRDERLSHQQACRWSRGTLIVTPFLNAYRPSGRARTSPAIRIRSLPLRNVTQPRPRVFGPDVARAFLVVGVGVPGGLLGHDGLDRGDADRLGGRGDCEGHSAREEDGAGGGHGSWVWLGVGEDEVDEAVGLHVGRDEQSGHTSTEGHAPRPYP